MDKEPEHKLALMKVDTVIQYAYTVVEYGLPKFIGKFFNTPDLDSFNEYF